MLNRKEIKPGFIIPSAALGITPGLCKEYVEFPELLGVVKPGIGDVVYGQIERIGQHSELENQQGRIHALHESSSVISVYGERYAPDYFLGVIPKTFTPTVDLLARGGIVGEVKAAHAKMRSPTKVRVLGLVCTKAGGILNTLSHAKVPWVDGQAPALKPNRAKLILVIGTSMNSGKSQAAVACCWALRTLGHKVRASKVTGTASLKDILHMQDAGASPVSDFTYLGYPSTAGLAQNDVLGIFNSLDAKYANNPDNFWVVEIADGIFQRETMMLLHAKLVRRRIHRLIFAAADAAGAIGGLGVLEKVFGLEPDAVSGIMSSSPLAIREFNEFHNRVPVFDNLRPDVNKMASILL